jgi:hypothetical protein
VNADCVLVVVVACAQDERAPILSCPADLQIALDSNGTALLEYAVGVDANGEGDNASATLTCTHAPNTPLRLGTHVVVCTASNSVAEGTCLFVATVIDRQPPQFVGCPELQIVPTNPDDRRATVDMVPPPVQDNSNETIQASCNFKGRTSFLVGGPYTVVCSASDSSSNAVQCRWNLTVVDTQVGSLRGSRPRVAETHARNQTCFSRSHPELGAGSNPCCGGLVSIGTKPPLPAGPQRSPGSRRDATRHDLRQTGGF